MQNQKAQSQLEFVALMASLDFASLVPTFGTSFSRPARAECGAARLCFSASAGVVLLSASLTAAATLVERRGEWMRVPCCGDDSRFKTGERSGFLCGDCSRLSGAVSRLKAGEFSRLTALGGLLLACLFVFALIISA